MPRRAGSRRQAGATRDGASTYGLTAVPCRSHAISRARPATSRGVWHRPRRMVSGTAPRRTVSGTAHVHGAWHPNGQRLRSAHGWACLAPAQCMSPSRPARRGTWHRLAGPDSVSGTGCGAGTGHEARLSAVSGTGGGCDVAGLSPRASGDAKECGHRWAVRTIAVMMALALAACSQADAGGGPDGQMNADAASGADASADVDAIADGPGSRDGGGAADAEASADAPALEPGCVEIGDRPVVVAHAGASDEHALEVTAATGSATRWSEAGNEAVVLEIHGDRGLIGHLVLHQGQRAFAYTMHVGSLAAGEPVRARVAPLTAPRAAHVACVTATLTAASDLGAAGEGLRRAPIFRWPAAKRFDDIPVLVGWSRATASYQAVFSHENGGTVASCGGGARGMEAEIARWGRGFDIEGVYTYGGTATWGRCTGTATASPGAPRMESAHPVFYYGDGHNRLFEHRGGYGRTCGSGGPERADGHLTGWNTANPGNEEALDGASVVTLRPLPVDLDALDFAAYRGRREGLVDRYAPWIYRLTWLELEREGRIDGEHTWPLDNYLRTTGNASRSRCLAPTPRSIWSSWCSMRTTMTASTGWPSATRSW
jgi:hypothetical protein